MRGGRSSGTGWGGQSRGEKVTGERWWGSVPTDHVVPKHLLFSGLSLWAVTLTHSWAQRGPQEEHLVANGHQEGAAPGHRGTPRTPTSLAVHASAPKPDSGPARSCFPGSQSPRDWSSGLWLRVMVGRGMDSGLWVTTQRGQGPVEQAQYTQLTGTHWGSIRSFSMAAWSSRKVLSRLQLTRLRSK